MNLEQVFVRRLGCPIQNLRLQNHVKELVVTENDVHEVVSLVSDIRLALAHDALSVKDSRH